MDIKIDPDPNNTREADILDVILARIRLESICEKSGKPELAERIWQIPDEQFIHRINQERGKTIQR